MTGPRGHDPDEWGDPLEESDAGVSGLLHEDEPLDDPLDDPLDEPRGRRGGPAYPPSGFQGGYEERGRPRAVLAFLVVGLVVLVVLVVVGVSALGNLFSSGSDDYAGGGNGTQVQVQVMSGDTTSTIAQTLETDGVVKSAGAFTSAAADNPAAMSIQPGYYELMGQMSGTSALALMLNPTSLLKSRVTIPEGSSLDRTVALIAARTTVPKDDLLAALMHPTTLGLTSDAKGHAEGFLFPATYDIPPSTTATQALQMLAKRFGVAAEDVNLDAGAKALGMTPYQVVTVASLIEREAAVASDRPMVASVIYNRLKMGMTLGLESTVRYALGNYTGVVGKAQLTQAEPSPFDTYNHTGLPPAPIDNPGEAALTAALHPSKDDNLYFVTLPKENVTKFVATKAEFDKLTARCQDEGGC